MNTDFLNWKWPLTYHGTGLKIRSLKMVTGIVRLLGNMGSTAVFIWVIRWHIYTLRKKS